MSVSTKIASMVGRRVKPFMSPEGVVVKWDPLNPGSMCDTLVRHDDGSECWYASHSLRPAGPCQLPLPSREEVRRMNDLEMRDQLRGILGQVVREVESGPRWEGCEFGKALVGNAVSGALAEVEERIKILEGK